MGANRHERTEGESFRMKDMPLPERPKESAQPFAQSGRLIQRGEKN